MERIIKPKRIRPREVMELMKQGGVLLVDVRSTQEFMEHHIPGAVSLPLDRLPTVAQKALPDKDATVILYCLSGGRSAQAARLLAQMGYRNVRNLGGMHKWPYSVTD